MTVIIGGGLGYDRGAAMLSHNPPVRGGSGQHKGGAAAATSPLQRGRCEMTALTERTEEMARRVQDRYLALSQEKGSELRVSAGAGRKRTGTWREKKCVRGAREHGKTLRARENDRHGGHGAAALHAPPRKRQGLCR
eukprot:TRINITY_DN13915_c0_g1_i1.p4 TRINITY_DN13915_c0_g1~~TRINITY_DN13915_c0_g1_i1.p4  ORF type:complete len:137 (+),score=2.40 TRINITY_DN13915_c0_g1_i1:499-909(+)